MTCLLALLAALTHLPFASPPPPGAQQLRLVGIQLEFPEEKALLNSLDRLVADHPDAPLIVLSELTFNGPIPDSLRDWCRDNERHVLVGAKEPVDETGFYNTAVVIGPDGSTVFQQHKIVPVQLMNDGIPGEHQALWDSPWGRLGIAICYDLSYTRVMDELVRQGAEALLIPTMDVIDWGRREHELHARVAPVRAAEYRLPIFRLCSSGISHSVDPRGTIRAMAPFPGQGEILADTLELRGPGRLPWDRSLAPAAVVATAGLALWFAVSGLLRRRVKL
jgi:apolipoprotein N-acyltransferase